MSEQADLLLTDGERGEPVNEELSSGEAQLLGRPLLQSEPVLPPAPGALLPSPASPLDPLRDPFAPRDPLDPFGVLQPPFEGLP